MNASTRVSPLPRIRAQWCWLKLKALEKQCYGLWFFKLLETLRQLNHLLVSVAFTSTYLPYTHWAWVELYVIGSRATLSSYLAKLIYTDWHGCCSYWSTHIKMYQMPNNWGEMGYQFNNETFPSWHLFTSSGTIQH